MLKKFNNKLCIGTAQFQPNYGISNNSSYLGKKECIKIAHIAKGNKITFFDTAKVYKNSEKILGLSKLGKSKIITKLKINLNSKNLENEIEFLINDSLKKLKIKTIYAVLVHNPPCLLSSKGNVIFKILKKFKMMKKIEKIGISAYGLDEIKKIIKKFKIDIISFPYNPFDNRLFNSGIIKKLKKRKIEIHTRSIFLQGLLLLNKKDRPKKFHKWNHYFEKFDNFLKKVNLSPLNYCLVYALQNKHVNKITIGVSGKKQLEQIFKIINKINLNLPKFSIKYNRNLANPNYW